MLLGPMREKGKGLDKRAHDRQRKAVILQCTIGFHCNIHQSYRDGLTRQRLSCMIAVDEKTLEGKGRVKR